MDVHERRELAFLFGVALVTTISSETWCLNFLASDFVNVSMCQHYPSEMHESTATEECLNARSHQIDVVNFDQEDISTSLMKYDTTHYEIVWPPYYKMLNLCLQSSSLRNLGLWSQILTRNLRAITVDHDMTRQNLRKPLLNMNTRIRSLQAHNQGHMRRSLPYPYKIVKPLKGPIVLGKSIEVSTTKLQRIIVLS